MSQYETPHFITRPYDNLAESCQVERLAVGRKFSDLISAVIDAYTRPKELPEPVYFDAWGVMAAAFMSSSLVLRNELSPARQSQLLISGDSRRPNYISLRLSMADDESNGWSLSLMDGALLDDHAAAVPADCAPAVSSKSATLTRRVDGKDRDSYQYRLCADGVVRRRDRGDLYVVRQLDDHYGVNQPAPDRRQTFADTVVGRRISAWQRKQDMREEIANECLEASMGVNLLPVGGAEYASLEAIVTDPQMRLIS